nr:MAG TPA: hypothetical protein [Bacteriophage sp.]
MAVVCLGRIATAFFYLQDYNITLKRNTQAFL